MENETKPSKNTYDVWKIIESRAFTELKPVKVKIAADLPLVAANAIAEETFSPYKDFYYNNKSWRMACKDGRHFFEKGLEGTFLDVYVSKAGEEYFDEDEDVIPF